MEQRTEKRLNHCLELTFGHDDTLTPGWTRNISQHGILIGSENHPFHVDNEINIFLKIGSDSIALAGVICWNNELPETGLFNENQMGLFIAEPSSIYCDYIKRLL